MNKNFVISLFFLLGSATLSAQVKLLPIFSDNMVLQQQTQAPIWGESKPNKKVEITTSWDQKKYTMPIMVSLLRGDIYKTEYGSVYLGLSLTVLPLIAVYLLLSKYIIAGVALGGVKG